MSKGLICDRCGAVITNFNHMNEIQVSKYCGIQTVNASKSIRVDLCKDCTETLMQYINNEVDMVIFNYGRAEDDQTEHSDPGI